jgi:hypothetical protein
MHVHAFAFCRPDRVQSVTYSAVLDLMLTKESVGDCVGQNC